MASNGKKVLPNGWVAVIELRQVCDGPPAVVSTSFPVPRVRIDGPLFDVKPISVRRGLSVLDNVMEGPEAASAVIEHTIQYKAHSSCMHRSDQRVEGGIATQEWINLKVVKGVISVIAC